MSQEGNATGEGGTPPVRQMRRSPRLTVVTDSELQTWSSCPQKHHFQYRDRLRPLVEGKALAVGSIFHHGMARGLVAGWDTGWKSRPNSQRLADQIAASAVGIDDLVMKWASKVVAHSVGVVDFEKLSADVDTTAAMVKWMLAHYFTQTQGDLTTLVLVEVEHAFHVDIHNKRGHVAPYLKYAGVRDAVMFDPAYNQIVLMEHKTAGGDPRQIEKRVEMDTQTKGYLYALKQQRATMHAVDGTPLAGAFLGRVAYNVLRKSQPKSPKVNQNGMVSIAACDTSAELYKAALDEQAHVRALSVTQEQAEFFKKIEGKGDSWFARVEHHQTADEIERWRSDTFVNASRIREAERDPAKRTRNTGHCNMAWSLPCQYRSICLDNSPELRSQFRVAQDPHSEVRAAESDAAGTTT